MATLSNELWADVDLGDRSERVDIHASQVKLLAPGAGNDIDPNIGLPAWTPMAFNTALNFWAPWDANGGNGTDEIRALLTEATVLDDVDEVHAVLMLTGKIHYQQILDAVEERAVEVEADLNTELRDASKLRDHGILVYGLTQTR
jgi:hypothetical protein